MTTNWIGGTGGWNTIANWSDGIPNALDADATIATPGTITLESGAADQVDSLLLNNAAATLNLAGSLALSAPFALLDVAAGTVLLPGTLTGGTLALETGATLTDQAGTFAGALDSATGATINLGGGTLTLTARGFDRATINGAGTLAISGIYDVGGLALTGGQTEFLSAGLAVQDGTATLDSALLTIASGAAYEINAPGQALISNGAGTIINSGLFTKANDDSGNSVGASFTNTSAGVLAIPRGVLALQGGGFLGGTLTGGGELDLGAGGIGFTLAAASDSLGTLFVPGQLVLGANQSFAGTFLGIGGGLQLAGQNLTLSGTADFVSADITGPGALSLSGNGALQGDGFNGGATLIDAGSINQLGNVTFDSTSAFTVAAGADYDLTSDSNLVAPQTIVLAGEIEKTAGTGLSEIEAPVANTGLILDLSGTLDFVSAINNSGLIESTGPGDILLSTVTGAGTIAVIDSQTTLAGPVAAGQIISFSGTGDVLTLSDAAAMAGKITGFSPTDTIALADVNVTPGTYTVSSTGLLTLPVSGGSPLTVTFASSADNLPITLTANGSVVDATSAIPAAASTTEWDGASADWNSANWSNGIPNAATINAGITAAGAYVVSIGANESFAAGGVLFNNAAAYLGLFGTLNAQSFTLAAGDLLDSGVFTGALTAAGGSTINLGKNLTVSSYGAIGADITGVGTLDIAGLYEVGGQTIGSDITEQITGIAIQNGTATFAGGALLAIAADAVYDVNADNVAISSTGSFAILNAGLFTKANDSGTTDVEGAITNTSAGVITVPAGAIDFLQGGILDGTMDGPGEVLLGAGTFSLATSDDTIGTLGIGNADVVLGAAQTLAGTVFTSTGSTINLNGHNLTLSGTSSLAGASIAGTGILNVSGTGETDGTTFGPGATLLDSGSIYQDGAVTFLSGAAFTIAPNAAYDITSDSGITASGTIILDGTLAKTAGTATSTIAAPISVASSGLILGLAGDMAFLGPVTNNGLIESTSTGNISLATVTGTGTLELLSATMTLGTVSAGQTISLAGTLDVLTIAGSTGMAGTITGFGIGDTIVTAGFVEVSENFPTPDQLVLTNATGQTETLAISASLATGTFIFTTDGDNTDITDGEEPPVCYLRGTRILTPAGEREIERLQIGDAVITKFGGYRQIKWIGRQSYARRFIRNNFEQIPVRIMQGALGPNCPKRDLFVSAGHSMLINNTLILASSLVNGITIRQDDCPEQVDYFQLEFETHDCILAEGVWSESYADTPDWRNKFHNAAEFFALYPNHIAPPEQILCAPRPLAGPGLEAALRPIIATLNPPPGRLHGYIDEISEAGLIRGWAWDEANPHLPVLLEILVNNRIIGTILACDPRPDLQAANIPNARAAFTFSSPLGLHPTPAITIRRATDGATLPQTAPAARAA